MGQPTMKLHNAHDAYEYEDWSRRRPMERMTMRQEDPGLYDYLPYYDRPKIIWPGGRASCLLVCAEYRAL